MCIKNTLLFALLVLSLGLYSQELLSTDQQLLTIEQSLNKVDQMLLNTEIYITEVKAELLTSKQLLSLVQVDSQNQLQLFQTQEERYKKLLKLLSKLERNLKIKNWIIASEGLIILIFCVL